MCANAYDLLFKLKINGCGFGIENEPDVEFLTWPIEILVFSFTLSISFIAFIKFGSFIAIFGDLKISLEEFKIK